MSALKDRITTATTAAMKARDKLRVATMRLINSEIKRIEVDERRELSDEDVLAVLGRMLKQRHDSLSQFQEAGRDDLADKESYEIDVVREFMPQALSAEELSDAIDQAFASTGASSMKDMGKVMAALKQSVAGRADMGQVSAAVKAKLSG